MKFLMSLPVHFGRGFALFAAFFALALSDDHDVHAQTPDNVAPPFEWHTLDTYEPWHAYVVRLPIDLYNGGPGLGPFGSPLVACGHSGTYASLLSSDEKDLSFALIKSKSRTIDRISVPYLSRVETVLPSSDGDMGTPASVMVRFRADKNVVYVACSEDASHLLLVEAISVNEMAGGIVKKLSFILAYGLVDLRVRTLSFLGVAALPNAGTAGFIVSESNSTDENTVVGGSFADVSMHSIVAPQAMQERLAPLGMSFVPLEKVLEAIARTVNLDRPTRYLIGWSVHKTETSTVAIFRFWDRSDEAATCGQGEYGILDLADQERQAYACNLGRVLYERFLPFPRQAGAMFAALKNGSLCSGDHFLNSRPLYLGTINGLKLNRFDQCQAIAMHSISGEAFSRGQPGQWVVLKQGTGLAMIGGSLDRRGIQERIGLALEASDSIRPITKSPQSDVSTSHCTELETTSSNEHAFSCNDGWFIYADREVMTR